MLTTRKHLLLNSFKFVYCKFHSNYYKVQIQTCSAQMCLTFRTFRIGLDNTAEVCDGLFCKPFLPVQHVPATNQWKRFHYFVLFVLFQSNISLEICRLQIKWSLTVESLRWVWHQQWPVCDPSPCAWEAGLFRKREKSRNRAHRSPDGHRWRRRDKRYHTAARGNKAVLVYNPAHLAMRENTFIKIWYTNIFVFYNDWSH